MPSKSNVALKESILEQLNKILAPLTINEPKTKFEILNAIKQELGKYSPLNDPVDVVQWVSAKKIRSNTYNPNNVAPPEMRLLTHSILMDGFTQPIVVFKDGDMYEIVDGFHRFRVGTEKKKIKSRLQGYLPVVIIDKPISERMASTIRHNRARGKHGVKPMSEVVGDLIVAGWEDAKIAKELGMEADEVLRLKQRKGLPELFKDEDFSRAWVEEKLFAPLKELKSKSPEHF
ncbi:MAG: IbrB-like domain-containing protein [Promethearchaeota archaeon]